MGLFRKLFPGKAQCLKTKERNSFIKQWTRQHPPSNHPATKPSVQEFHQYVMLLLSWFPGEGEDGAGKAGRSSLDTSVCDNDCARFELACFVLFDADLWLFLNAREQRAKIINLLYAEIAGIFEEALQVNGIGPVLDHRMHTYGAAIRAGKGGEALFDILEKFISYAGDADAPKIFDLASAAYINRGVLWSLAIHTAVLSHLIPWLPFLREYLKFLTQQPQDLEAFRGWIGSRKPGLAR